jgi:anti-sigma B factor antagonist
MEFAIDHHKPDIQVVSFRGRLTFGPETQRCREALRAALAGGERNFVFDLAGVEYADSAGLGFLVSCLTTLRQAGAELRLAAVPEKVAHVLHITRLDTVFRIFPSRGEAVTDSRGAALRRGVG